MNQFYIHFLNISLLPLRLFRLFKLLLCCYRNFNSDDKPLLENDYNKEENPNSFISWNIQELFLYTNTNKVNNIINRLKTFVADIICLQEVFEDKTRKIIIEQLKENYPFYLSGNNKKKYIVGENSGLLILSKFPIEFVNELPLQNLCLPDSMAFKTIMYFKVGNLNFATSHLQSIYEDISKKQLYNIIDKSPFKKFILIGDLNNENVFDLLNIKSNNSCKTCENSILDYIIPINYNLNINVKKIEIEIENTSDHYPIIGKIKSQL